MARSRFKSTETVDEIIKEPVNEIVKEPIDETKVEEAPKIEETLKERNYKVNVEDLNVRTGPGLEYPIAAILKEGTPVTVKEVTNSFGKIDDGLWVSMQYLK